MKHLIPPSYRRAAIVEKLAKILYLVAYVLINIIIYNQFKN